MSTIKGLLGSVILKQRFKLYDWMNLEMKQLESCFQVQIFCFSNSFICQCLYYLKNSIKIVNTLCFVLLDSSLSHVMLLID